MKRVLLLCSCIFTLYSYSQSKTNISLYQDARLLFVGDDKGNDAFTANILAKAEFPILTFGENSLFIYPSAEYADLAGGSFQRYAIGLGYVFDKVFKNIGASILADYGNIYRNKRQFSGVSMGSELTYRINNLMKIGFLYQYTQRRDLEIMYDCKDQFILSGFFGVKFYL